MATPGVRCGIGSGRGRCLSLADYVRGPRGQPGDDRRRRGLMLTILGAAQCQRMEQISNRKQGETQNRTPEIDVMTEAMRETPVHPRKQLKDFRHMGSDDHEQAACADDLD